MKIIKFLVTCILLANVSSICAEDVPPISATLQPLNHSSYMFFFRGKPLVTELTTFANNNNLNIYIDPVLSQTLQHRKIVGRFTAKDFRSFLSMLSRQYDFKWFIYANTLYITSSKVGSITLRIPSEDFSEIRNYLDSIGLLIPEFGYTELINQNKIIVSGPNEYLNLVEENVTKLNINPVNQQFAVFRLKYASAVDTQLSFNNQTINIPGVASLLEGLLGNNSGHKGDYATNVNQMLKNGVESNTSLSNNSNQEIKNYSGRPKIQADARLNTIIIQDNQANLKMYKNIIETLDVPAPLIQIDVLIIRLDQDKLAQKGINWWASSGKSSLGFGAANLANNSPTNYLAASYNQINPGQLIVTNIASFSTSLQFLEDNQIAKTQAKPSLATIDNLPAITTTTENIFSANTNAAVMNGGAQNANNASNNLAYTGIQLIQSLQITPHVIISANNQKQIRLAIALQDGSIDDFSNPTMPNYSQGYLNSQAVITEGQSVVLAGYTKASNVTNETKVPFLGDIPGLGWLFKSRSSSIHRITTMYVVTPRIVTDNVKLNNLALKNTMVKDTIAKNPTVNTKKNTSDFDDDFDSELNQIVKSN